MGLFKSKQQKELEEKLIIKKTMNSMNKQIANLEEQKQTFVEKAKKARDCGLDAQYQLALSGYKMTVAQQKKAQEMLLNFEITSQMKDMSAMTGEFLKGLSILSKEMVKLTDNKEFLKVQQEFEKAMDGVNNQAEEMDVFLDMSQDSFKNSATTKNSISDEEFAKMIDEQNSQQDITDDDIEKELQNLRKKMDAE